MCLRSEPGTGRHRSLLIGSLLIRGLLVGLADLLVGHLTLDGRERLLAVLLADLSELAELTQVVELRAVHLAELAVLLADLTDLAKLAGVGLGNLWAVHLADLPKVAELTELTELAELADLLAVLLAEVVELPELGAVGQVIGLRAILLTELAAVLRDLLGDLLLDLVDVLDVLQDLAGGRSAVPDAKAGDLGPERQRAHQVLLREDLLLLLNVVHRSRERRLRAHRLLTHQLRNLDAQLLREVLRQLHGVLLSLLELKLVLELDVLQDLASDRSAVPDANAGDLVPEAQRAEQVLLREDLLLLLDRLPERRHLVLTRHLGNLLTGLLLAV
ncbi:hypothetical protein [Planotetraspora sp. GP83]|uniref:hypothetical protein n=1 Tax=Planotetraspora sp. GP83 TaxID=3156264 RepID=UPI00351262FB